MELLVVSDSHYLNRAESVIKYPERQGLQGLDLLRGVWERESARGRPDVLILLGDLVENGFVAGADQDLQDVSGWVRGLGVPCLAVCGNHDGPAASFERLFNEAGFYEVGGYGFMVFNDDVAKGDYTTRRAGDLVRLAQVAAERPDLPLVALQHNPVYPRVSHPTYPYMLTNEQEVIDAYLTSKVILSLSGHYHAGQSACRLGGLTVCTVPALCEAPFRYARVKLNGRVVSVTDCNMGQ